MPTRNVHLFVPVRSTMSVETSSSENSHLCMGGGAVFSASGAQVAPRTLRALALLAAACAAALCLNAQWTKGSQEGLRFTSDGAFSKFTGVLLDGQPLDSVHYTAQSGSTIVELKASYLETVAEGSHTLRTTFSDGYAETTFTIKASSAEEPPTGPGGPPQPLYPDGSKPADQPGPGEPKPLVRTGDSTLPSALMFVAAAATGTLALALARKRAQKHL